MRILHSRETTKMRNLSNIRLTSRSILVLSYMDAERVTKQPRIGATSRALLASLCIVPFDTIQVTIKKESNKVREKAEAQLSQVIELMRRPAYMPTELAFMLVGVSYAVWKRWIKCATQGYEPYFSGCKELKSVLTLQITHLSSTIFSAEGPIAAKLADKYLDRIAPVFADAERAALPAPGSAAQINVEKMQVVNLPVGVNADDITRSVKELARCIASEKKDEGENREIEPMEEDT